MAMERGVRNGWSDWIVMFAAALLHVGPSVRPVPAPSALDRNATALSSTQLAMAPFRGPALTPRSLAGSSERTTALVIPKHAGQITLASGGQQSIWVSGTKVGTRKAGPPQPRHLISP
jgi:hypothetical protein